MGSIVTRVLAETYKYQVSFYTKSECEKKVIYVAIPIKIHKTQNKKSDQIYLDAKNPNIVDFLSVALTSDENENNLLCHSDFNVPGERLFT